MNTLDYIVNKFSFTPYVLDKEARMPIEIANFGRDQLATLFSELGFKKGAEIGVESGLYSDILLRENPDLTLYSIDAWRAYRAYRDHTSQSKLDRFYEETKVLLRKYGNRSVVWKLSSAEALNQFKDGSLDFVYIDANHAFYNVAFDIHHWLPKIRKGGIISGHDYKKHKPGVNIHVKQVVTAYVDSYYIKPWFVLGTNAKTPGEIRDDSRSWMWIKI